MSQPFRRLRYVSRAAVLVLAAAAVTPPAPVWAARVLPALSPFVGMVCAVAMRSLGSVLLICLPILLVIALRRRAFCRYACPVGLLLDLAGRLRRGAGDRYRRFPPVGQWVLWIAFGAALVGVPVALWLDPLCILQSGLNIWRRPFAVATLIPASGMLLLLVLSIWRPNLWCRRCCPLGALQESLHRFKRQLERTPLPGGQSLPGRRVFLSALAGGVGGVASRLLVGRVEEKPVRPPGALPEASFHGACIRCGNCIRVCPERILRPDLAPERPTSCMSPVARFGPGYCSETCNACGAVCPTGAITALTLRDKRQVIMGTARVVKTACVGWANQEQCMECAYACPYDAIRPVEVDYVECPQVDVTACRGCGACEPVCPAATLAIRVVAR